MPVLLVEADLLAARDFLEKRHQNTRWSRTTAPAELEPLKGLGDGVRLVWADVCADQSGT